MQDRNICSLQTGMSLVRTVSTEYYPHTAQAFYTLDFVTVQCFKQLYRKDLVLKPVYGLRKGCGTKSPCFAAIHFTVNCLHQCGCGYELCTEDV
jgi:hypothetical protein